MKWVYIVGASGLFGAAFLVIDILENGHMAPLAWQWIDLGIWCALGAWTGAVLGRGK